MSCISFLFMLCMCVSPIRLEERTSERACSLIWDVELSWVVGFFFFELGIVINSVVVIYRGGC